MRGAQFPPHLSRHALSLVEGWRLQEEATFVASVTSDTPLPRVIRFFFNEMPRRLISF